MKIKTEHIPDLDADIVVSYRELTPEIESFIQHLNTKTIKVDDRGRDRALNLSGVIFFETDRDAVFAHTKTNSYRTKFKLYELEDLLPKYYLRISKSCIVNADAVASLDRKLTSSRCITFFDTHKVAYVSRMYYGAVKKSLDERSLNYE